MKNTPTEKCAEIMAHYGVENQLVKLCEECGELIQAACKSYSRRKSSRSIKRLGEDFLEELADVKILISQFESVLNKDEAEGLECTFNFKLDRQLDRIKNERTDEP